MFNIFQSEDLQMKKFNSISEVRDYLFRYIENLDFDLRNPPYTSQIYHPLRKGIFQNFQPLLDVRSSEELRQEMYKLSQVVDEEMLNMFQLQLSRPYSELILTKHYGIPKDIDVEKANRDKQTLEAIQTLVSRIAEWNIQIERTVDSIQKVRFYKLWQPQSRQSDQQLTTELKALLSPDNDFSYGEFSKHIMVHILAEGVNKFGKFLKDHALSDSNLTLGASLLIYQAFVGAAAMPWSTILQQINVKLLFGGLVGSLALGKVSNFINTSNEIGQIIDCAQVFTDISMSLVEFNERITEAVNECLLSIDEDDERQKKIKLSEIINEFLEEPEVIKYGGSTIKASDLMITQEGDWTVVQSKNATSQQTQKQSINDFEHVIN